MIDIKQLVQDSTTDTSGKWLSLEDGRKLVERVVRECAVMADESRYQYATYGEMILSRFGVEK